MTEETHWAVQKKHQMKLPWNQQDVDLELFSMEKVARAMNKLNISSLTGLHGIKGQALEC